MSSLNIDIDIDIAQLNASTGSGSNRRAHPGSDLPNAWVDRSKPTLAKEKATNDDKSGTVKRFYPKYHEYWDADQQSYKYLNEFLVQNKDWLDDFAAVAEADGRKRPQRMNREDLEKEIEKIRNRVKDRASRASEIITQDDAEGAISCWLNLLGIDPARHRATNLMVRVGRRVGEHVVMCLKAHFKSPRPSQLCLAINPLIDAPTTPSFPAGHALQAYLISYLLLDSLPELPQHDAPDLEHPENWSGMLFKLAERVSDNRVVAGIHYPVDSDAGKAVAIACFKKLRGLDSIKELKGKIKEDEFPQYT
jgi:acid phosphatase (class A)